MYTDSDLILIWFSWKEGKRKCGKTNTLIWNIELIKTVFHEKNELTLTKLIYVRCNVLKTKSMKN